MKLPKHLFYILLIMSFTTAVAHAAECVNQTDGTQTMHQVTIQLLSDAGDLLPVETLIADDNTERAYGFQYICAEKIANTKILFVFDRTISTGFHMNNVHAPLDIGFFDSNGVLQQVLLMHTYEAGGDKIIYAPDKPFRYALEARVGFFRDNGMTANRSRLVLR